MCIILAVEAITILAVEAITAITATSCRLAARLHTQMSATNTKYTLLKLVTSGLLPTLSINVELGYISLSRCVTSPSLNSGDFPTVFAARTKHF